MATRPTKKQRELLSYIARFIAETGYGPSYREIMKALGYKSVSTVAAHVDNLIARGHLRKRENSARSLEVTTPLEGEASALHKKWLVHAIETRIARLGQSDGGSHVRHEIEVLIEALSIMGYREEADELLSHLNKHSVHTG